MENLINAEIMYNIGNNMRLILVSQQYGETEAKRTEFAWLNEDFLEVHPDEHYRKMRELENAVCINRYLQLMAYLEANSTYPDGEPRYMMEIVRQDEGYIYVRIMPYVDAQPIDLDMLRQIKI